MGLAHCYLGAFASSAPEDHALQEPKQGKMHFVIT